MQAINAFVKQYQLLSDWYVSVLEGIREEDGSKVISDTNNSLEWIAGHLITGRYRNLLRVGVAVEPYSHLDKFINLTMPPPNGIKFDPAIRYPTLTECIEQWITYSIHFLNRLKEVDEDTLRNEIGFQVLTGGTTVEDALTFIVLHETFHIGQMSIIRKTLGYPAMSLGPRN